MRTWILSVIGIVAFLFVSYWSIQYLLPLLGPFVIALVIAEMVGPVVDRLERWRVPRGVGVLLVLVVVFGTVGLLVTLGVAKLVAELQGLVNNLPYYMPLALDFFQHLLNVLSEYFGKLPDSLRGPIQSNLESLQTGLTSGLPKITAVLTAVSGVPALLTNLLVATVATFFITRDKRQLGQVLLGIFPPGWRTGMRQVRRDVLASALGFAKAQATLITLTMVLSCIGLALIGSQYALLVGLVIGLADILPVLGPAVVYAPWILYHLTMGNTAFGVKLLILYVVIGAIRQLLESTVVADKIGMHPLTTLFAVYVGFHFFGAMGFIMGPLLAITLKAMIKSRLLPMFPHESHQ